MMVFLRDSIIACAIVCSVMSTAYGMDTGKVKKAALLAYRYKDGQAHQYTPENFERICRPINLDAMGEKDKVNYAYQRLQYDARHAALAADFIMHDAPLNLHFFKEYVSELIEMKLEKMTEVVLIAIDM